MRLNDRPSTAVRHRHRGVVMRALDGLMRFAGHPQEVSLRDRRPGCADLHEALLAAIRTRDASLVRELFNSEAARSAGVGSQTPLGASNVMPLTAAVQAGSVDCVKLLVQGFGAPVNALAFADQQSSSLVMLAIQKSDEPMALCLLDLGADPNAGGPGQKSPLAAAIDHDLQSLALELIAKGADVRGTSVSEETFLQMAAGRGRSLVVQALLAAGVELNAQDRWGETALHHAVEGRSIPCIRQLMSAGADWKIVSKSACTPLVKAIQAGDAEVASALIETGADLAFEVDGVSAMAIASRSPVPEVAALGHALAAQQTIQRIAQLAKGRA